jgi:hypothetical protein
MTWWEWGSARRGVYGDGAAAVVSWQGRVHRFTASAATVARLLDHRQHQG